VHATCCDKGVIKTGKGRWKSECYISSEGGEIRVIGMSYRSEEEAWAARRDFVASNSWAVGESSASYSPSSEAMSEEAAETSSEAAAATSSEGEVAKFAGFGSKDANIVQTYERIQETRQRNAAESQFDHDDGKSFVVARDMVGKGTAELVVFDQVGLPQSQKDLAVTAKVRPADPAAGDHVHSPTRCLSVHTTAFKRRACRFLLHHTHTRARHNSCNGTPKQHNCPAARSNFWQRLRLAKI